MPSKFKPTRQRKHRVIARTADPTPTSTGDSNAVEIIPESKSEREARRLQLREELRSQPKISAKKQKRLDKYIENKLKKEENLDLIKRLTQEKEKYDSRGLQSSKTLRKRRFDEFVDGQVNTGRAVEVVELAKEENKEENKEEEGEKEEDDDDRASEDSFEEEHREAFNNDDLDVSDEAWLKKKAPAPQGTGLAQPLQLGPDGLPLIPARGRKRTKSTDPKPTESNHADSNHADSKMSLLDQLDDQEIKALLEARASRQHEDLPWEGFDSESESDAGGAKRDHYQEEEDGGGQVTDKDRSDEFEDDGHEDDEDDDRDEGDEFDDEDDEDDQDDDSATNTDVDSQSSASSREDRRIKPRTSAFKTWATQQLNQSLGHVPSYEQQPEEVNRTPGVKPAAGYRLGVKDLPTDQPNRVMHNVHVSRSTAMQRAREQLPVLHKEQEFMEAINNNPVVVIKGETGSGKTTQIPQFLYESGYGDPKGPTPGMIGITQPRRVAAVSMANRVGEEMGDHGDRVAHQIRFDSSVSSRTAIKFMTDGILLRELSQDIFLQKYSVIVIDEAHERSVNTDILIGMLSKVMPARSRKTPNNPNPRPLKLVIMSATLNIEEFLSDRLFPTGMRPPVVEAEGRQHKVTVHFARRSRPDYVEEAIEKVKRAHRKLPRGGILVFLTGQYEIRQAISRLRQELPNSARPVTDMSSRMRLPTSEVPLEADDLDFGNEKNDLHPDPDPESDRDDFEILVEEEEDDEFVISDDEADDDHGIDGNGATDGGKGAATRTNPGKEPYNTVHLLPLYSQLPTKDQVRVFDSPPEGARLIVLATNVAETSLTIPGIRYVFDCGRSKERKYNLATGVQSFEIDYVSKASAQQRTGRAGRTGPGHCWRLYSSALFEQYFPDHTSPEILRCPVESVVLQLKAFKYPRPVAEFPFPTAPSSQSLQKAETLLRNLGAISASDGTITALGKELALYPLSPRLGKILALGVQNPQILSHVIDLVAGLTSGDVFVPELQLGINKSVDDINDLEEDEKDQLRQSYGRARAYLSKYDNTSDAMKLLRAVTLYGEATDKAALCEKYFLRSKAMSEAQLLKAQLRSIVRANSPTLLTDKPTATKLSTSQVKDLNLTAAAGYLDNMAIRWDLAPNPPVSPIKPRRSIDVPYLPLVPLSSPESNITGDLAHRAVFIHPSSLLSRLSTKELPSYVVYTHLQQAQAQTVGAASDPKTRMFPLTPLHSPKALLSILRDTALIEYGKPVAKAHIEELSGRPRRRICWVNTEVRGGGAGTFSWPLPPSKVKQVMDLKCATGWRVEEVIA